MANEYTTITVDMTRIDSTAPSGTLYAELSHVVTLANNDTVYPEKRSFTVTDGAASIQLACTATAILNQDASYIISFAPTGGKERVLGRIRPTSSATPLNLSDLLEVRATTIATTRTVVAASNITIVDSIAALQALTGMNNRDRAIVEDIGLYRYSSSAADTAQGSLVVTPSGGTGRWFLDEDGVEWRGVYNVRQYGALGDSTGPGTGTNNSAAIQAAIDAAPAGSTILFPDGRYRINSRLTWSGKRLSIVGTGRASLVEGTAITGSNAAGAMLYVDGSGCDGTTIEGLDFEGAEAKAGFVGADSKEYCAVYANDVTDLTVRQVKITGKSWGVILDTCIGTRVLDLTFTSFLDTAASGSGAGTDNYNSAVRIKGGDKTLVRGLVAKDCGSGVLSGVSGASIDPTRITIENCHVENAWDNGIYLSSAQDSLVTGVTVKTSGGSGVKCRGSNNRVIGCQIRATTVGIGISGAGTSPDAYGATSHGCIVSNNVVEQTTRDGLVLDTASTYTSRHTLIEGNYFRNIASDGVGYAAIRADGNYYQIRNNIFEDCNGTTAAVIAGGSALVPAIGLDISHNQVFDSTGEGFRLQYLQNSIVSHNLFRTVTGDAINLRNSTNNLISYNKGVTGVGGDIIDATSANSNTGNLFIGNDGTLNVDRANNYVGATNQQNLRVATATPITMTAYDEVLVSNLSVAGAVAVTLPASPAIGQRVTVKDGKGDAGSNNITVAPAAGNVDGSASHVISSNYGAQDYVYNGTEWNKV